MGSSKDYIALPTSDEKTSDSSPSPSPPPYEEKSRSFPLRWKAVCLLLTFVGLIIVGFSIHPDREHGPVEKVDLGFPRDIPHHNFAQEALTGFMTKLIDEAKQGHHQSDHTHHCSGKNSHPHLMNNNVQSPHDKHHKHRQNPHKQLHHKHHRHGHHQKHHHHHQKRGDEDAHANQRRELGVAAVEEKQQRWSQSYRLAPSTKTSLHILSAHVHSSLMGGVTLRQDTTGIEQDIVVTFHTNTIDGTIPVELSTNNFGDAFFVRARNAPVQISGDYSIDIVFPSSMTTMKKLDIHINNGTIHADASLQATFESVQFSTIHGAMSVQKLTADRIMLGTYSGIIAGTFQPKDRFAVGVYYGHSNVRLLQSSINTDHCRHLHIASSSPHGVAEVVLEHGAFDGQFIASRTLDEAPKVDFTSNDNQLYDYQVMDQRYFGWFMNNTSLTN
ncbi:hypothetical protein BCR42DRAFT_422174 [Absidia repens]|uniref:Adhesin domain-containing protein n=1 Tax=Absidia repens TaxID=90262 RepID=A0A1X2I7H6_9FUNG|nr:hypothetical protein BCR42DRAFT_422174 [Absidia repens]